MDTYFLACIMVPYVHTHNPFTVAPCEKLAYLSHLLNQQRCTEYILYSSNRSMVVNKTDNKSCLHGTSLLLEVGWNKYNK